MSNLQTIIDAVQLPDPMWMKNNGIVPASASSLMTMETCPMKFNGTYGITIPKIVQAETEATIYGNQVHKAIEDYLKEGAPLPRRFLDELPNLQKKVDWVKQHRGFNPDTVEGSLAINRDGSTLWRGRALGVKSDVLLDPSPTLKIYIDWKTNNTVNWKGGKKPPNPKPIQLEITAIIMFMQNPVMKSLIGILEFLRHDERFTYVFNRAWDYYEVITPQGLRYKKDFEYPMAISNYWALQQSKQFKPKPCGLCNGWCEVTSCPEWKPKSTAPSL